MPPRPLPKDTLHAARWIERELEARGKTWTDLIPILGWDASVASRRKNGKSNLRLSEFLIILSHLGIASPLSEAGPSIPELVARALPALSGPQRQALVDYLHALASTPQPREQTQPQADLPPSP